MNIYFIVALALAAVLLFLGGRRYQRWGTVLEALAINIFAAALILLIQKLSEKPWNIQPILLGGGGAVLLMLPFVVLQQRRHRRAFSNLRKETEALQARLEGSLAEKEESLKALSDTPATFSNSGLNVYARNYAEDFQQVTGREFGEYVRSFVTNSPPGSTFKVAGIDWTELFGSAISATSERYMKLLANPQTNFRVILLDPRSPVGLEKRLSEFKLVVEGKPHYIENHPDRVYGKTIGSAKMMAEYHRLFPIQFQYRFVRELLTACWIMNDSKLVFYLYTRCHKGWDSPIFIADKVPKGIYGFFDQYFEFLWQNPNPVLTGKAWTERKRELSSTFAEFDQLIKNACSGPLHQHCPKI